MQKKALVVIDIQNDITKNYRDVIENINKSIDWAVDNDIHVVYIRQEYLVFFIPRFRPNTYGSEFVSELKIVSNNVFTKHKASAFSSAEFRDFIAQNEIAEFYLAGADATACVKATCCSLLQADYDVTVLSDCITSYAKKRIDKMLQYYESQGSKIMSLEDLL